MDCRFYNFVFINSFPPFAGSECYLIEGFLDILNIIVTDTRIALRSLNFLINKAPWATFAHIESFIWHAGSLE